MIAGTRGARSVKWVLRTQPIARAREDSLWFDFKDSSIGFFYGQESIRREGSDRIEITLFEAREHPFRVQLDCYEAPKAVRPKNEVAVGDPENQHQFAFWVLPVGGSAPRIARLPHGYRGAFVFSDHADQGSIERTRAIGDAFLDRGLVMTKTVFNRSAPGYFAQAQNPAFLAIAKKMQAAGVEIGLHSPSGQRDTPQVVERSLAEFRRDFRGTTWIDHQPDTNCEAISNQGWAPSSPWGILSSLQKSGFRYLWAGEDQPLKRGLALDRPFWTTPSLPSFTLFSSAWAYVEPQVLARRYARPRLQDLARHRGIHIAHTYLDTFQAHGPHAELSLLVPAHTPGTPPYEIHPVLATLLNDLVSLQKSRDLWVTTVERLGAAWDRTGRIHLEPGPKGSIRLSSNVPIPGLTLLTSPGASLVKDEIELPSQLGPDGQQEQWFDLVGDATLKPREETYPW